MGRKEQRIKNKLEKNPIKECLSIQKSFIQDYLKNLMR